MKTLNKILSTLIILSMLLGCFAFTAFALETVTISAEKAVPGYPVSVLADGNAITTETVTWYVSETEDGEYTLVDGASGDNWQITNSCANMYIKADVDGVKSNAIAVGAGVKTISKWQHGVTATTPVAKYSFRTESTTGTTIYYTVLDSETVDGKQNYLVIRLGTSAANGTYSTNTSATTWNPDADPATEKTMAYWLDNYWSQGESTDEKWTGSSAFTSKLESNLVPYVVDDHTWLTERSAAITNDYTFKASATVLSIAETVKYADRLYSVDRMMLRNGHIADTSKKRPFVYVNGNNFSATTANVGGLATKKIFPIFYLSEDVFKNVKLDLSVTGEDVRALIVEHNNSDEETLKAIGYTDDDLIALGVKEDIKDENAPETVTISVEKAVPGYPVTVLADGTAITDQTVLWYVSDTEDGAYEQIVGETGDNWQIINACANKYIKAEILGVKSNAIAVGKGVTTTTSYVIDSTTTKPAQYSFRVADSKENASLYYQMLDSETVDGKKQYFIVQLGSSVLNGKICSDSTNLKWDPTLNSANVKHLAYWLENYWSKGLTTSEVWTGYAASSKVMEEALREYVPEHTWLTERSAAVANDYTFKAHASILSIAEVLKYRPRLYADDIDKMFMRNGHIADTTKKRAYSYVNTRNIACIAPNTSMASTKVLPAFYLTEDFFKNVKLDLNATGAEVLSQLAELNTIDELASIGYTQKEIAVILNGVNEFYLADSTGSELPEATVESEDNKLYLKASITNRLLDKQGVMLAVARYKDDYLDKIVHNTFDIESGETLEVAKGNENEMSIDIDEGENVKYKIFVWDSLTNAPITESKEYKDMKKIIFIGNSYTFYGMAVINAGQNLDDDSMMLRQGDEGYFYQLSKQNNADFHVTNWTWGGHNLKDIFGESCAAGRGHDGHNHLADFKRLLDTEYDYVVMQPTPSREITEEVLKEDIQLVKDAFSTESPDAKYILLLPAGYYVNDTTAKKEFRKCLATIEEDAGVTLVDWGNLISDLINGTAIVEDTEIDYNKNTFIVSASSGDGYHQNQLSGYITAQFVFSTLTGKKAEGENYAFCTDDTIHPSFSVEKYLANYYLYDNISTDGNLKGDDLTTYPEIFKSPTDMLGIQKLIDKYIEEKPYMNE